MRVHRLAAAAALVVASAPVLLSQQPTFRAGVDLVRVDVSVSRGGEHLEGLTAANFAVSDNGVKQKLERVIVEQVPLEAYLVLDLSGSVAGAKLDQLKRAANAFVDGLVARDQVALITFAKEATVRQPLTSDFGEFRTALSTVKAEGNTALYDAVARALTLREPRDNRGVLVVFTDGQDNASTASADDVVKAAERSDVIAYSVTAPEGGMMIRGAAPGFGVGAPQVSFQVGFLRSLADATGGRVFRAMPSLPLEELFAMVLDDARSRYVLTYYPDKPTPGWHKLSVKLVESKGDVVARRGYYVGTAAAADKKK
jgi:Ca-activated chloride channel homolog